MGNPLVRLAVVVLILAAAVVVYVNRPAAGDHESSVLQVETTLPRLLDLGADKCIPCKTMAPILVELDSTYAGVFEVDFIDVWKNPEAAKPYGIQLIPTQIFFSAEGEELFRHQGFYGREDILSKWTELGIALPDRES